MATLLELAAEIVSSHASTTALSTDELLQEIQKVYSALQGLETGKQAPTSEEPKPAIRVKDAFKKNEVICMICGKGGMKTLARHLTTIHSMKPGAYKKQFGIPSKQPLAAKSFSESRRQMALDRGLAGNLAKARAVRAENLASKKAQKVVKEETKAKAPAAKKVVVRKKAPSKQD
jgi:predicted transcriptional regulator